MTYPTHIHPLRHHTLEVTLSTIAVLLIVVALYLANFPREKGLESIRWTRSDTCKEISDFQLPIAKMLPIENQVFICKST